MRLIVLIALCLTVASASYSNRSRFNRLLRALQQQQDEEEGCGRLCRQQQEQEYLYQSSTQDDLDETDEDEYQQQYPGQQCGRTNMNLNDNEDDDDDDDQYGGSLGLNQRQGRQGRQQRQTQQTQQQRRRQQQANQCRPQFQLLQELEQANSQLASRLYKQAKQENDDKNTVVSPAALQLALAAIQRGARGNTRRQLQRVTGAALSQQQNRQAHTALHESLQGQDPMQKQTGLRQQAQVRTTTTVVVNQGTPAQQQFIQAVQACLNAQVKTCNFQRQPQQCRQQINQYVAQRTNRALSQTVPQDAVTQSTKMVVVNTAQVKARWGRQFRQQQQTTQARFFPLGGQQPKSVQVMQTQGQFNYYEDEQLQVVGIPTQQQEMTLYVMVPKNKDGLNQVEKTQIQDGQQLRQLLEQTEQQQQQVQLELPKFQIKHKLDARQTLRNQGVQDVFDADQADLSAITGQQQGAQRSCQQYGQNSEQEQCQPQLHVNKLIHQATIKVDEQGITSARSQQSPEQDQYQYQEQDEDEDEQEQEYMQQQFQREQLFQQLFRQPQRQRQQRQRQQYQDQDEYGQAQVQVRANRAFAFALKHNPSNQIVLVGRVVDAAQPTSQRGQRQGQQSLNGVDQQ